MAAKSFYSADFLSGTIAPKEGVFCGLVDAMGSNDPKRVADASADCLTGLSNVSSILRVMADYMSMRNAHPEESLFASDIELVESLCTMADLVALCHGALNNGILEAHKTAKED